MAQMTGYVCDVCEKFALDKKKWMALSSPTSPSGSIDICSNKCLVKLGKERLNGEKELLAADPSNGEKPVPFSTKNMVISEDQKLQIVSEAMESGVKAAADAHGIPWQAVARWKSELTK